MKFCKLANIQGQEEADPVVDENHQPNLPLPTPTKQQPPALPQEEAYRTDIEDYLLAHAPSPLPQPNYFPSQPDLSEHMRGVLLNWLVEVNQKYKLMDETFFLTVKIIDAYLRAQPLTRNKLQLLGITALWIAAKFQETYQVPKVENLVYICDSAYSVPDILAMEGKVLTAVGFDLLAAPSPLLYFKLLQHHALLSEKDYWLARYLLEATAFEIALQKYSPSVLVYSLVFFIKKLRGDSTSREEKVRGLWRAGESEIRTVARELCRLWQRT
jgi:cyclin B